MSTLRAALLLSVLALLLAPFALAQGTYTQIDYPGAKNTGACGISSTGDIVGYYQRTGFPTHGFLLQRGAFHTIDYPGFSMTNVTGRNSHTRGLGPKASRSLYWVRWLPTK